MQKEYEFGFSRLVIENPTEKLRAIVESADKMSKLGWEYKGYFDSGLEFAVFYQREKETIASDVPLTETKKEEPK